MKIANLKSRSEFTRNVLKLITGTTVAQLFSILASPILSRLFSQEDFAELTTFTTITGVIALVAGLRYESAILLPKRNVDAANLLVLAFGINALIAFVLAIVIGSGFIFGLFPNEKLMYWMLWAPLVILSLGLVQSYVNWLNRIKSYNGIVRYRIAASVLNNGGAILNGLIRFSSNGLVFSYIVSIVLSFFVFYRSAKKDFMHFQRSISLKRIRELAKKYRHFPLVNTFQGIMDGLQINGIILLISAYFYSYLGAFGMAVRILLMPMNFIGGALAQIFYQQASEVYNKQGDLQGLLRKMIAKSALLALPVLLVVLLFGPQLFEFVLGHDWRNSGEYAQLIVPWLMFDFVRSPVSIIPLIIKKQNRLLLISVVSNLLILSVMLLAAFSFHDFIKGIIALTIIQVLYSTLVIGWIYRASASHRIYRH